MTPLFCGGTGEQLTPRSRLGVFDHEMRFIAAGGNDSAAEDFRDHTRWVARAIHAVVGLLIRRHTLRVKFAKAVLVAEQRPAGHGHAARKEDFDGRIEPDDRY